MNFMATGSDIKTVLITGAASGIGQAAAKLLVSRGCRVIIHGRNRFSACACCRELDSSGLAVPVWGDLAGLKQVRSLAGQLAETAPAIDIVILNAGIFQTGGLLSKDGFELDFAVNYLSQLLLIHLLFTQSQLASDARIVFVSSSAYINGSVDISSLGRQYLDDPMMAYATSKQLNIIAALELAGRLSGTGICVNACNPGPSDTKLLAEGKKYGWKNSGSSPLRAARRLEWLALSPDLQDMSGFYFNGKATPNVPGRIRDRDFIKDVYETSMRLCKAEDLMIKMK